MKKLLFIAMLLCSVIAFGQNKNDVFTADYVDEFTGDTIIATKGVTLYLGFSDSFVLNLKHSNGINYIGCTTQLSECYNLYADKSLLYIKFTDGTIRKASCSKSKVADYKIIMRVTLWSTSALYNPEEGFIEDLATKEIEKFRYETSIGNLEYNVKPKRAKEFKRQTRAFLSRLSIGDYGDVETKYKNGDYVWIIKKGKPRSYEIESTEIRKDGIYYYLNQRNSWDKLECKESQCYSTKEEAIDNAAKDE